MKTAPYKISIEHNGYRISTTIETLPVKVTSEELQGLKPETGSDKVIIQGDRLIQVTHDIKSAGQVLLCTAISLTPDLLKFGETRQREYENGMVVEFTRI